MSARQRFTQAHSQSLFKARSKLHSQTDFTKDRAHILQSISDKTYVPTKNAREAAKYALVATRSSRALGFA